jgi:hypothetical protein
LQTTEHIKLPQGSLEKQTTTLNFGPTHPATHGVFQNIVELDGERIIDATQTVGYIHRAFEKIAERRPLYQITPLLDRMNYCSSPINDMGWHLTCEKLLGIKTPKRVDYLRVIIMELARISDHLICNSIVGVDSGAYTGFLYVMQYRELIYEIYEEVCGSRLTTNIGRISISYTPGLLILPQALISFVPVDFPIPMSAYASPPLLIIGTTAANVSTLLTTVGQPYKPFTAGKGGFILGSPRLPSRLSSNAVSSPHI